MPVPLSIEKMKGILHLVLGLWISCSLSACKVVSIVDESARPVSGAISGLSMLSYPVEAG
jgi:hypothetical protein